MGLGTSRLVATGVQCQVVGAGERALAVLALEWLGAGVFAKMSGQLVRPREAPLTAAE